MKDKEPTRPDPKAAARQAREQRLAAALRANLRRRKAPAVAGEAAPAAGGKGAAAKPEAGAS